MEDDKVPWAKNVNLSFASEVIQEKENWGGSKRREAEERERWET